MNTINVRCTYVGTAARSYVLLAISNKIQTYVPTLPSGVARKFFEGYSAQSTRAIFSRSRPLKFNYACNGARSRCQDTLVRAKICRKSSLFRCL